MSDPIRSISQNNYLLSNGGGGHEYSGANGVYVDNENEVIGLDTSASNAIETVIENSGAWGGAGLPISAGPGIKVALENGVLMISKDETLLYSGSTNITSGNLNESARNFELLRVSFSEKATEDAYAGGELVGWLDLDEYINGNNVRGTCAGFAFHNLTQAQALGLRVGIFKLTSDTTFASEHYEKQVNSTNAGSTIGNLYVTKVVGIGRKST